MVRTPRSVSFGGIFGVLIALVAAQLLAGRPARSVGYTERVRLEQLGALELDHRIAVEIEGSTSPYLRGRTLSRYRDGRWLPLERTTRRVAPDEGVATHRVRVREDGALFLPLGARPLASRPGLVEERADGTFVARSGVREVGFRLEDPAPREADPLDIEVPRQLRDALEEHARALAGEGSDRARAERLRRALATEKSYRLDFAPRPGVDPVIDFLERAEGGHCEVFASAYVLLARSLGIPARLVSGYYATEREEGRVRAKRSDAHAWAEVYVEGRYRTVDPTPPQRSNTTTM